MSEHQSSLFDDDDEARKLARNDDPDTSKAAAKSLNLALTPKHHALLAWLGHHPGATYEQMAVAAVEMHLVAREEQGRRMARTLREVHGRIDEVIDPATGKQAQAKNRSGRMGVCWKLHRTPVQP